MEHYLSLEEIEELKADLKKAEPYPPGSSISYSTGTTISRAFDGETDFDRERATVAKYLLDTYYEEKGWEKDY